MIYFKLRKAENPGILKYINCFQDYTEIAADLHIGLCLNLKKTLILGYESVQCPREVYRESSVYPTPVLAAKK